MPSAKSTSVAASAIQRAAVASANRQTIAANTGSATRRVRTGKPSWFMSDRHCPGGRRGKAQQHYQGIGIDIARLQPAADDRAGLDHPGGAIGAEAIDNALIAGLPEEAADREGGANEQEI